MSHAWHCLLPQHQTHSEQTMTFIWKPFNNGSIVECLVFWQSTKQDDLCSYQMPNIPRCSKATTTCTESEQKCPMAASSNLCWTEKLQQLPERSKCRGMKIREGIIRVNQLQTKNEEKTIIICSNPEGEGKEETGRHCQRENSTCGTKIPPGFWWGATILVGKFWGLGGNRKEPPSWVKQDTTPLSPRPIQMLSDTGQCLLSGRECILVPRLLKYACFIASSAEILFFDSYCQTKGGGGETFQIF